MMQIGRRAGRPGPGRPLATRGGLVLAVAAAAALAVAAGASSGAGAAERAPRAATLTVRVDTATGHRAISPLIYGLNGDVATDPGLASVVAATHPGLLRLGGNRWTAYNWENNASNAGSDWYFENDDYLTPSKAPGAAVASTVKLATANGAAVVVTVPIVDYVAADESPPGDVRNSGPDYLATRFRRNEATDPAKLTTAPDQHDKYVYEDQFVYWLEHAYPKAKVLFSLDNEPDLWSSTHAEVHPKPVTYAELATRDLKFAAAVKKVWPAATVTGPVSYGWEGYETLQNAPDAAADGNFLDWYLAKVWSADAKAGHRLVNDLDLHWYPEATGGGVRITGTDTTPAVVAAREQAPRSLWDPHYVEASWITEDTLNDGPIKLIPRLEQQIAAHDPGMNLDFSEWDYGGGQDISGAIATADVLGIFGRYGVHASAFWPLSSDEQFAYGAFRIFRNYDGHGAGFGDTEVRASTGSPSTSSVYASIEASHPSHVVIVLINKAATAVATTVDLSGVSGVRSASVFALTSASAIPRKVTALRSGTPDRLVYSMPAQSVSVLVPTVPPGA